MDEQNIPIDIAVRKLVDWLVSRRLCTRDWHEAALRIRGKISVAMQDMPENEAMRQLLAGTHINYFHCLRILDILKETEADSKNFFGQYGSKRMKDWKEIVSEYENQGVYLAEAAQALIQNVVYEIPGIKKQLGKCEQFQAECNKKEENACKRIKELEEEYRRMCSHLGIPGTSLRQEIIQLAKGLPVTYAKIAQEAKILSEVCTVYEDSVKATLDEGVEEKVVENLRFLIHHGDVTTYQWKYGETPISIEPPELAFTEEEKEEEDGDQIDFGDNIDFGTEEGEVIDFGSDDVIDFGRDDGDVVADDVDLENVDTSAIVVEAGGLAGGVAREEEALSLLDNRRIRALLLDELEELAGFLSQRLVETEGAANKFSLNVSQQLLDTDTLRKMLHNVEKIRSELTEVKMQHLQMIRGSPSYADRLADTIKQKLRLVDKVKRSKADVVRRREESEVEQQMSSKQLAVLSSRTKELQGQLEADISRRYKGRPVHIMGVS